MQLQSYNLNYTGPAYVAWLSAPVVIFTGVSDDMVAAVPQDLQGISYAAVVSSTTGDDMDSDLLTGFTIVEFPFSSYVSNPGPQFSDSV